DWVNDKYLNRIQELLDDLSQGQAPLVSLLIGSRRSAPANPPMATVAAPAAPAAPARAEQAAPPPATPRAQATTQGFQPEPGPYDKRNEEDPRPPQRADQANNTVVKHTSYLNRSFTFENFV